MEKNIHTYTNDVTNYTNGVGMKVPDTTGRSASPKSLVNARYRNALWCRERRLFDGLYWGVRSGDRYTEQ